MQVTVDLVLLCLFEHFHMYCHRYCVLVLAAVGCT